jgi:hypothetical protein
VYTSAQIVEALVGLGIGLQNIEHYLLGSDDDRVRGCQSHSLDGGKKTCDHFRAFGVVTPGIRKPLGGFDDKLGLERLALRVALHQSLSADLHALS